MTQPLDLNKRKRHLASMFGGVLRAVIKLKQFNKSENVI